MFFLPMTHLLLDAWHIHSPHLLSSGRPGSSGRRLLVLLWTVPGMGPSCVPQDLPGLSMRVSQSEGAHSGWGQGSQRGDIEGHLVFLSVPSLPPAIQPLIWYQQPELPLGSHPCSGQFVGAGQPKTSTRPQPVHLALGLSLFSPWGFYVGDTSAWGYWASFVSLGERSDLRITLP